LRTRSLCVLRRLRASAPKLPVILVTGRPNLDSTLRAANYASVEVFHTPLWRSNWLSHRVRQYCIFGLYRTLAPGANPAQADRQLLGAEPSS